eukprot:365630-Chlamydomonas_euryale.AAC.34
MTQLATAVRKEVIELDNLTTSKAVDALLNFETVTLFNNQALEVKQYDRYIKREDGSGVWCKRRGLREQPGRRSCSDALGMVGSAMFDADTSGPCSPRHASPSQKLARVSNTLPDRRQPNATDADANRRQHRTHSTLSDPSRAEYQSASGRTERLGAMLNGGQAIILALGMSSVMLTAVLLGRGPGGNATPGDLVMIQGLLLQLWAPLQVKAMAGAGRGQNLRRHRQYIHSFRIPGSSRPVFLGLLHLAGPSSASRALKT